MSRRFKKQIVEIEISDFSKKGNGIGSYLRHDGIAVSAEIPFTMPGDRVLALLTRKQSGRAAGMLEEIITPASERSPPRCIHFSHCGGCRWQHLPYAIQLQQKEEWIRREFTPFLTEKVALHPIVGCEPPWQYRNKMEFSFSNDKEGKKFLGLILNSSRGRVLNLTECHLTRPWFIEALTAVRNWWEEDDLKAYHPPFDQGSLRTLILREGMNTGDRLAMLTVSGNPDYALKKHHLESFVETIRKVAEPIDPSCKLSIFLRIQQLVKGSPTQFYEMHLYGQDHLRERLTISYDASQPPVSLQFKVSPSAFFQPNTFQAERLYSHALQLTQLPKGGVVYDLYCGTGTLGICASRIASQVLGIELSFESSLDARENAKANGAHNVTVWTGDVAEKLKEIRQSKVFPSPDLVMVDPPRVGLDKAAIRHLLELKAKKILYISCNPSTQASNILEFVEDYQLVDLQPVDQFPQTAHLENIAILERK